MAAAQPGFVLEIEASNSQGCLIQLFYNTGQTLSQFDSVDQTLVPSDTMQTLRFALPAEPIKQLRLDPANGPCLIRIGRMRLLTSEGRRLLEFGPECLHPMWQIDSITLDKQIATVRSLPSANDPMLLIDEPLQAITEKELGRVIIGPRTILALGAIAGAGLIMAVVGALMSAMQGAPLAGRTDRWLGWAVFGGVFLIVAGVRLACLKHYSSPIPFWDEWESDGLYLLMPLRGHYLDWHALVVPQNEHRILLTRLITLVGTLLNGEWDPRLGMVLGALFFALSLALIARMALRAGPLVGISIAVVLAVLGALPIDHANLFWGGQSQMYALVLLATCTLVLATTAEIRPWVVWCAGAASVLSLFTMGSGLVAPGLGAAICSARLLREPAHRRKLGQLIVVFGLAAMLGLWLRTDSRYHAPEYAKSFAVFWPALSGFGAWPLPAKVSWLVLRFIPWLALFAVLGWRSRLTALEWLALGLGGWALINACGLAYARPDMAPPVDSRHFTSLIFGLAAMVTCTGALCANAGYHSGRWRWLLAIGAVVAVVFCAVHLVPWIKSGINNTQSQASWREQREQILLPFLRSGDRRLMQDLPGDGRCPYWNSAILAAFLESPLLQPVLPAKLRKALASRPGSPWEVDKIEAGAYTIAARSLMKAGTTMAAIGVLLLGGSIWLGLNSRGPHFSKRSINPRGI